MIDPANFCVICGEEANLALGGNPLCFNHFAEALHQAGMEATEEELCGTDLTFTVDPDGDQWVMCRMPAGHTSPHTTTISWANRRGKR